MKVTYSWPHCDPSGGVIGKIKRFPGEDSRSKKDIPCYRKNGDDFLPGIPSELKKNGYPLFGFETVTDKSQEIIISEGQKTQTAYASLGFPSVTSILGASCAHLTNWQDLDGVQTLYLSPDYDAAGEEYAKNVFQILNKLPNPPDVKIIRLPGLPDKGDICDWLKQQPELADWDELQSLHAHPSREILIDRLQKVIDENLQEVPDEWRNLWPDPQPIRHELLPVDPLPPAIIPEPFRDWITDIAHRMQCPIDFVAAPAIVMVGAIVGAGCGIKPKRQDDWLVIPNLWGGVVGNPGKLKTPAIAEALRPLDRLIAQAKEEFDADIRGYEIEVEAYEAQRNALKDELKKIASGKSSKRSIDAVKADLTALNPPKKPIWHRYKTNDATVEKMGELLADNLRGIFLIRDELIGLMATWDKEGHESDRAFFLETWTGYGSNDNDRIGRGTTHTDNMCTSIFGGIQPGKLIGYLYQAMRGNENDGLLQRFQILVYPNDHKEWKLIDQYPNTTSKNRAFVIVEKLAKMNFTEYGAILDGDGKIPYFRFSDDALELFYEWLTGLEKEKVGSDSEPIIIEHLSKYRSLMPSLALIFHLIGIADGEVTGPVSLQATELAAAWCDYLEGHSRRIYGLVTDISTQAAAKLAKKIQQGAIQDGFTIRDVYRKEWGYLDDKNIVQEACEELLEAGWLREEVIPSAQGQRGKAIYRINPKIGGQYE